MVFQVQAFVYKKMNPTGNICVSPQLGMSIKDGESGEHGERLSNSVLPHLWNNWIQNPELEYFQWGLLLELCLGVGVGFVPDVHAQDYLFFFIRLLIIIRLYLLTITSLACKYKWRGWTAVEALSSLHRGYMHLGTGRRSVKDISLCPAGAEPVASGFPEQGLGYLGANHPSLVYLTCILRRK